ASTGNDLSYVQGVGGTGSQYIPPMQGFFVNATTSGTFTLDNSVRTHNGSSIFYKSSNPDLLVLEVSGEQYSDQSWIHFNDAAGAEHDGVYDAYKRISLSNSQLPQIYSITPGGDKLSVNGMPETESVKLGLTAVSSGEFTIRASQLMESRTAILEDLRTGRYTDISTDTYTFSYKAGETAERFMLHFNMEMSSTEPAIYASGNYIYINTASDEEGKVQVYDLTGRMITEMELRGNLTQIVSPGTGIWLVKVMQGTEVSARKLYTK
ncbi:MAG: T9SS type A sorting domain-containing protein, partial [Bacteroidales bacterium]|nr:T9SS type A sorting domain-containing protein [Bacteroidales bacterium]